jgi:hypothetical protein
MTRALLFALLVIVGMLCARATPSHAQVRPENRPITQNFTNERGFTLDMFDGKLWALARHPFSPATMDQFGAAVHKPPTRGIQFELLTPGDFGVSMHLYW